MVTKYVSALKNILKDRYGAGEYINNVLIRTRKKKWSELTEKEKGEYQALEELYSENKDLSMYQDQLFYALNKYPELDKAFRAGTLNNARATKILYKKIDDTLAEYIKRIEDMIKKAESGEYTYTVDDIYAVTEELSKEGISELFKDRKSLNMLVNRGGGSIDEAGRLDVLADAVERMELSDALLPAGRNWDDYRSWDTTPDRMDPTLANLRKLQTHLDNLPEEQLNLTKTAGTADDFDFWDGEDATYFTDPFWNDSALNSDRLYASANNVTKEGKYEIQAQPNLKFVYQDDVWPLLKTETKNTQPKTGDIAQDVNNRRAVLEQEKSDLEGQIATAESYIRNRDEPQLNREGKAMLKEAQKALEEIEAEIARLTGVTKKQGGGFIDSPLYLRDY
jgi:hypothetical protein